MVCRVSGVGLDMLEHLGVTGYVLHTLQHLSEIQICKGYFHKINYSRLAFSVFWVEVISGLLR